MTATEERKLQPILQYFIDNGFKHTTDEICEAVGITKKTLFNRYGSKEKLEETVIDFFELQINRKIEQKISYCNNSIEAIVFYIDDLYTEKQTTPALFEKVMQKTPVSKQNPILLSFFDLLIARGQKEGLFNTDLSPLLYADFFFNTLFFFFLQNNFCNDIITYILCPLLTEEGKNEFNSIDVENLLFGPSLLPKIEACPKE